MTKMTATTTVSLHTGDPDDSLAASFKFESGDLKDEGRVGSDSVLEYDIAEPGYLRLAGIIIPARRR